VPAQVVGQNEVFPFYVVKLEVVISQGFQQSHDTLGSGLSLCSHDVDAGLMIHGGVKLLSANNVSPLHASREQALELKLSDAVVLTRFWQGLACVAEELWFPVLYLPQ